jgi:hypothetical protein
MARTKKTQSKRGTKRAGEKPVDDEIRRAAERAGLIPAELSVEAANEGARAIVQDDHARRLVHGFLDWDGGQTIGVSALWRISHEANLLAHYLHSSSEPEFAAEQVGRHLLNLSAFANAAAAMADAEAGGAS